MAKQKRKKGTLLQYQKDEIRLGHLLTEIDRLNSSWKEQKEMARIYAEREKEQVGILCKTLRINHFVTFEDIVVEIKKLQTPWYLRLWKHFWKK